MSNFKQIKIQNILEYGDERLTKMLATFHKLPATGTITVDVVIKNEAAVFSKHQ